MNLVIASFAFAILISGMSSVMAQRSPSPDPIGIAVQTGTPTLGCCKCLGGANSSDLSTISSNSWMVKNSPAVIQASPHSAWNLNTGGAKWLSLVANGSSSNIPAGPYDYKLTFVVPDCTIDQQVTLKGSYGGDDDVQVFLDNTAGAPLSACSGGWCFNTKNTPTPFVKSGIIPGTHILIVRVTNSSASPSGMFVNAQLTSACSDRMTKQNVGSALR
jgi:hypothetical protein